MIIEAIFASLCVALASLVGVFFFGTKQSVATSQKYIIPLAVGVFLSLVLFELIPETLAMAPVYGGIAVGVGFILFYVLSAFLHKKYHTHDTDEHCDKKGAAMLLLIGDAVHNVADGIILGGAFLVSPAVGAAAAVGLVLHELPQEIVEFGVLLRAGFSRARAAAYNLISASSIFIGTLGVLLLAEHAAAYMWILTGVAAGNLLFLAGSDLLPRIHGNVAEYGGVRSATVWIIAGFVCMTSVLVWTHAHFGHGHEYEHDADLENEDVVHEVYDLEHANE